MTSGARCMLLSAFWFSLMSLGVALAARTLPAPMMVMARGVVSLVVSYAFLRRRGIPAFGAEGRGLLILRGLFGFGGLFCFFWSLTRLPIAEASVIQFLNPLLTAMGAALILGEPVGRSVWIATPLCLAGTLLVARPAFLFGGGDALDPSAVAVAVAGAFCAAGAYITIRKIGRAVDPMVIVFSFPVVSVPLTLPLVIPVWQWPTPVEWLLLVGLGLATQMGQVYMTRGLQETPSAGRATAISYAQIVFATLWGLAFLDQVPHVGTLAGSLLIVVGCLAVTLRRDVQPAV